MKWASEEHGVRNSQHTLRITHYVLRIACCVLLLGGILALGLQPNDRATTHWMRLAHTLAADRRYMAALEAYQQALHGPAPPLTALLHRGQIYLHQHRYEEAAAEFTTAIHRMKRNLPTIQPSNFPSFRLSQAHRSLGEALAGQGDTWGAIREWHRALELNPRDNRSRYLLGRAYMELGQWDEAQQEFQTLLALYPDDPVAHYQMGLLLAPTDLPKAIEHWRKTISAYTSLSPTQSPIRDPQSTIRNLIEAAQQALAADDSAYAAALMGRACLEAGELRVAERFFAAAVAENPAYAEAWAYLGHVRVRLGQPDLASLHRAIDLDPNLVLGPYFLGVAYRDLGHPELARVAFEQALRLDPYNPALGVDIAQTYLAEPDYVAAEAWLQAAVEQAPDDPAFQLILARFYVDYLIAVPEKGVPAAERAVELAPDSAEAHDVLGWAYALSGRLLDAETELREALRLNPDLVSAHYHLGSVYAQLGQSVIARQYYTRVLDLDTTGHYRARAEQALKALQP